MASFIHAPGDPASAFYKSEVGVHLHRARVIFADMQPELLGEFHFPRVEIDD